MRIAPGKNGDYNHVCTIRATAIVLSRGGIWWIIRFPVTFGNYEDNR